MVVVVLGEVVRKLCTTHRSIPLEDCDVTPPGPLTHLPQTQARARGPCAQAQVSAAQVGDLPLKDAALAVRKLTHSLRLHLFQPFLNLLTVLFLFPSRGRVRGYPHHHMARWNDNHRT